MQITIDGKSVDKFDGRKIAIKALVGSHNYNLNTLKSDRDYKLFVYPSFEDLYQGRRFSTGEQSADVDYTVHDIRSLTELIWKSNINFIEVLFSTDIHYVSALSFLIRNAEKYASMNLLAFYKATYGMYHEKMKNLHKGTATTQPDVDKYGYDPKQACHALRCLLTLSRYHKTRDMKSSLWFEDGSAQKQTLIDLKNGLYTEDEFISLTNQWHSLFYTQVDDFYINMRPIEYLRDNMEDEIKRLCKLNLT